MLHVSPRFRHRWHPNPCMRGAHYRRLAIALKAQTGPHVDKLLALLKSRKFWAAVIGLLLIIARNLIPNFLPFSDADITAVLFVLISYILGTALEDGLRARSS